MAGPRKEGKQEEQPKARKKPGRKKGSPKVPGSGRKKGTVNWTSEAVRERLMPVATEKVEAIIRGDRILTSGSTGKDVRRRPSLQDQLKAAELAYRKCLADLASTTLSGPNEQPLFDKPVDVRDTARAIVSILHEACLESDDAPRAPPPPPEQKLLTRSPIIEINPQDGDAPVSGPSTALEGGLPDANASTASGASSVGNGSDDMRAEHPPAGEDGECVGSPFRATKKHGVTYPHNQSSVFWSEAEGKWIVTCWTGDRVCRVDTLERAEERAIALNGPDGKQHEFTGDVVGAPEQTRQPHVQVIRDEARCDNRPLPKHREPRVLRRPTR